MCFFFFLAPAISDQFEQLSKSIINSLASLTLPSDVQSSNPRNNREKKSHVKAPHLIESIDITVLLLMYIISATKLLRESVTEQKVVRYLLNPVCLSNFSMK